MEKRNGWNGGERRKRKTNSRRWLGRRRPILGEKGEEVIDGTSVMVQPSISRTYTFIIYYPRRYGYFASGTSYLSLSLSPPITPRRCFPLAATPDASAKPKGRPVTKQPFPVHPSVHGFVRARMIVFDRLFVRSIFENIAKIWRKIPPENSKTQFRL